MSEVTVYTTQWCGYCRRLKAGLNREGIPYDEVDIETDPAAANVVTGINRGDRTVPTVVFADGSALTNPSVEQISSKIDTSS